MKRLLTLALAALVGAGCAASAPEAPPARPRLVVLLVVDGLGQHQVTDYRDQLAPDGLARFLDRGAWFADAHYKHAYTVTAPGHAVVLTGAYPHRTGIIGNEWRNPENGAIEYSAGDPAHHFIGHEDKGRVGTSPRNLKAESLGDVLRSIDPASKVIGISAKDRAAILLAGRMGVAYVYRSDSGHFASTTYYMKAHPRWVEDFNAANPADRYFHARWKPLLEEAAYAKSLPDGQPWYYPGGHLPKTLGAGRDKPDAAFYDELIASPFSDRLTLDFARAAIAGEALGADDAPDILSVSLSGLDSVNHEYSPESRLSQDYVLHLDRALQDFFRDLDAKVGRGRYVAVLTADHGFAPAPELSRALGRDAARLDGRAALARMQQALAAKYGMGRWVIGYSADTVLLDRVHIESNHIDLAAVTEDARRLLMQEPGFLAAYTRTELQTRSRAGEPFFDAVERSFDRERSGDVAFVLKPWWIMASRGSTHGSPHPYDTHVPILLYGPAWMNPGRRDMPVEVADIAPTLAQLLGVRPPSSTEGWPLPLR